MFPVVQESLGLQCKASLSGGCGLSCSLHGDAERGSRVTGRSEVTSCRWVGDSAGKLPALNSLDIYSTQVRLTQGRQERREVGRLSAYPIPCVAWDFWTERHCAPLTN